MGTCVSVCPYSCIKSALSQTTGRGGSRLLPQAAAAPPAFPVPRSHLSEDEPPSTQGTCGPSLGQDPAPRLGVDAGLGRSGPPRAAQRLPSAGKRAGRQAAGTQPGCALFCLWNPEPPTGREALRPSHRSHRSLETRL